MMMCIQNLVGFCQFVLKILSGNHIFTESRNNGFTDSRKDGMTEGQGESSIAPLFQSGAIIISRSQQIHFEIFVQSLENFRVSVWILIFI